MNVPQHVAIILDGNGRWAKAKGMLMFGLINNIYFLPDGIGVYFWKILEWILSSIILVAIIAIIENKKIEDKVKKLNQME